MLFGAGGEVGAGAGVGAVVGDVGSVVGAVGGDFGGEVASTSIGAGLNLPKGSTTRSRSIGGMIGGGMEVRGILLNARG